LLGGWAAGPAALEQVWQVGAGRSGSGGRGKRAEPALPRPRPPTRGLCPRYGPLPL